MAPDLPLFLTFLLASGFRLLPSPFLLPSGFWLLAWKFPPSLPMFVHENERLHPATVVPPAGFHPGPEPRVLKTS
jgi:hypothetical protein